MALTKVGSVGIATGISLTGVTTTQDAKVGTGITLSPDGDGYYTGIITATKYYGDGSTLSNITTTTINNNADKLLVQELQIHWRLKQILLLLIQGQIQF